MQLRGSLSYEQIVQIIHKCQKVKKANLCALTFNRETFLKNKFEEIMDMDCRYKGSLYFGPGAT